MHYRRWQNNGDPLATNYYRGPRPKGEASPKYLRGDKVNYWIAHRRVREARGSASDFVCPCGAPAKEWAYDKKDSDQRFGPTKANGVYIAPYSLKVEHYVAMCVLCHRRFDRGVL